MSEVVPSSEICPSTYTAEQVAQILGISVRFSYEYCETTTDFGVKRLGKRCLRIHKKSFDEWFAKWQKEQEQADLT